MAGEVDIIINEDMLRDKIYTIRGQKVMLDYDLAKIYGYTTSAFNRQVKNNVDRFEGEDFMFQLTRKEIERCFGHQNLDSVICKNYISQNHIFFDGQNGGTRKLPYAFTEQGIYMLMTVLRGPLAIRQSRICQ